MNGDSEAWSCEEYGRSSQLLTKHQDFERDKTSGEEEEFKLENIFQFTVLEEPYKTEIVKFWREGGIKKF